MTKRAPFFYSKHSSAARLGGNMTLKRNDAKQKWKVKQYLYKRDKI